MKHVYFFNEGSQAALYGIGTYSKQMKSALSEIKDLSLNLVYLNYGQEEFQIEEEDNCRIFMFPAARTAINIKGDSYLRSVWYILQGYILPNPSDQLFFHLNSNLEYIFISLAKEKFPACKIIFTIHYLEWAFKLKGNYCWFKQIIQQNKEFLSDYEKNILAMYEQEKLLYAKTDHLITLAKFTTQHLIEDYRIAADKIHFIPNGMEDKGVPFSSKEKNRVKSNLYFNLSEKIILFVGRLNEGKGLHFLIEAFKKVLEQDTNCRLIIAGEGDYATYYKGCSPFWGKITFTGHLKKEELYNLYQIADLGVLPSLHEQCSYVAIEMLMFDIPLLISNAIGLNEMMEGVEKLELRQSDTRTDISVEELASSILKQLSAKREKGFYRNMYLQNYSLSGMKDKIKNLYAAL